MMAAYKIKCTVKCVWQTLWRNHEFSETYLYNTRAWVKEDTAFGFLRDLFILVEVHDVGVICELSELEVSPLKWLHKNKKYVSQEQLRNSYFIRKTNKNPEHKIKPKPDMQ